MEFPTLQAYDQHKLEQHQKGVSLPNGITPQSLPSQEFISRVKQIEEQKEAMREQHHDQKQAIKEQVHPIMPEEYEEVTVETPKGPVTARLPKTALRSKDTTSVASSSEIKTHEDVPLALSYHWTGNCTIHHTPVQTFEVTGEFTAIVAYCLTGNHQVESKRVIPVKEQTFKKK